MDYFVKSRWNKLARYATKKKSFSTEDMFLVCMFKKKKIVAHF